jgi:hypothetical protein
MQSELRRTSTYDASCRFHASTAVQDKQQCLHVRASRIRTDYQLYSAFSGPHGHMQEYRMEYIAPVDIGKQISRLPSQ